MIMNTDNMTSYFGLANILADYMIRKAVAAGTIAETFKMPTLSVLKTQALMTHDNVSKRTPLEELSVSHGFVFLQAFKNNFRYTVPDINPKSKIFRFHFNRMVHTLESNSNLVIIRGRQADHYFLFDELSEQLKGKCRKDFVMLLACENRLVEDTLLHKRSERKCFRLIQKERPKVLFTWDIPKRDTFNNSVNNSDSRP